MSTEKDKKSGSILKGPSYGYTDNLPKREMWKEIAAELKGEFKIKHDAGNTIEIHHIKVPHKEWFIEISVSDSRPLKFECSFSAGQDFNLIMSGKDFIENLMSRLSKSKVVLGWNEFDNKYLVKSNRSDLTKKLFTKEIQKEILKHHIYSLSYQTNHKSNTSELLNVIQRQAGTKDDMLELIKMHKDIVDKLSEARIIK